MPMRSSRSSITLASTCVQLHGDEPPTIIAQLPTARCDRSRVPLRQRWTCESLVVLLGRNADVTGRTPDARADRRRRWRRQFGGTGQSPIGHVIAAHRATFGGTAADSRRRLDARERRRRDRRRATGRRRRRQRRRTTARQSKDHELIAAIRRSRRSKRSLSI